MGRLLDDGDFQNLRRMLIKEKPPAPSVSHARQKILPPDRSYRSDLLDFVPCPFLLGSMPRGEPVRRMTLGSMRCHGVLNLFVTCQHCGQEHARSVWMNGLTTPRCDPFGPRMRCSRCGKLGATAVPNCIKWADRLPGSARR
jgi:hypothetical protein